ncbi:MAG TPA: nitroreductase family protein [Nitrospirota bacterium]|nr:nitroreductase family protein [Nitrospirota bacterium]
MKESPIGDLQPLTLLEPVFDQCLTVFEALKIRRTSRAIGDRKIPLQILSDILWAAQGINRIKGPFGGLGRTAGSASNSQEICIYVAMEQGTYLYEPDSHRLTPVAFGDIRALAIGAWQGKAGANAPVRLIYVVDIDRFDNAGFKEPGLYDAEIQKSYYFTDTGLIAQNVYLACASLGLASWFHNCNKAAVAKEFKLEPHQRPLFGQTIGYAGQEEG